MHAPSHTRSWSEVRQFYQELVQRHGWPLESMLELVELLEKSSYAGGMFPFTSHESLHIGRVPNFARGDNELEIQFNPSNKSFVFTYWQRADDLHPWTTACEESEWRYTLERVLHKRLRWFHVG